MMNGPEKSDPAIVATKPTNKAEQPSAERSAEEPDAAEPVERRAGTKGNAGQQSTRRTQRRASVSQALERIRKVAKERKKERFTALYHHINIDLLEEAFFELKTNGAPCVDRLTWKDYEADLECNLEALHGRVQREIEPDHILDLGGEKFLSREILNVLTRFSNYRTSGPDHWGTKPLDWAMERIAQLIEAHARRDLRRTVAERHHRQSQIRSARLLILGMHRSRPGKDHL